MWLHESQLSEGVSSQMKYRLDMSWATSLMQQILATVPIAVASEARQCSTLDHMSQFPGTR